RPERRSQELARLLRQHAWHAMRHLPERSDSFLPADSKGKDAGADSRCDYSWRLEIGGPETLHDQPHDSPLNIFWGFHRMTRDRLFINTGILHPSRGSKLQGVSQRRDCVTLHARFSREKTATNV